MLAINQREALRVPMVLLSPAKSVGVLSVASCEVVGRSDQSGFGYSCLACKTETTSTALAVMRYTIM